MFWSIINGGVVISLMFLGGLKPLQAVAVLTSFTLMFIMLGAGYFLIKDLQRQAEGKSVEIVEGKTSAIVENLGYVTGNEQLVKVRVE